MARNPVQFQKGISLNAFLSLYATEDQCFDALFQWRWPNGLGVDLELISSIHYKLLRPV